MSIPIMCSQCCDVIGIRDGEALLSWGFAALAGNHDFSGAVDVNCPGTGKHLKPVCHMRSRWFGLIKEERWFYPETMTYTEWQRIEARQS